MSDNNNPLAPDAETVDRIKSLAVVGTALEERSNGAAFDSNIFAAMQALESFMQGIHKLSLEPASMQGMENLAKVLKTELQKRLDETFEIPQQNY